MRKRTQQHERKPLTPEMLRVAAPSPTKARGHRARRRAPAPPRAPSRLRRMAAATWRSRWRVAFGGVVSAALVVVAAALVQSGLLDVRSINVEGAKVLNQRVLIDESGLRGANVLSPGMGAAERRLEQLPLVAGARVERDWPLGIRIRITERTAWAVWSHEGVRTVVDREGRVLDGVDAPPGVPLIIDMRAGQRPEGTAAVPGDIVGAARDVLAFAPAVVGVTPKSFRLEDGRGLVITTAEGYTAVFGDGQDFDYKLGVWRALLDAARGGQLSEGSVRTVDLRFGDRPSLITTIDGAGTPEAGDDGDATSAAPQNTEGDEADAETAPQVEPPEPPKPDGGLAAGDIGRQPE